MKIIRLCVRVIVAAVLAHGPIAELQAAEPDSLRARGEAALEAAADDWGREDAPVSGLERLAWILDHPLDLRTAEAAELELLPKVSASRALAFVIFRSSLDHDLTEEDLRRFEADHPGFMRAVLPFSTWAGTGVRARPEEAVLDLRSRAMRDLQPCAGTLSGAYAGSSVHHYHRIGVTPGGGIRLGAVVEKDAGEDLAHGLYSAHVVVGDLPWEATGIIGDYRLSSGQGLVLGRSTAFSVASDPVSTLSRPGLGLEPNRSSGETEFLRGAGVALRPMPQIRLSAFYSDRRLAASDAGDGCVASVDESGLFRTAGEIGAYNRLHVRAGGGIVRWDDGGGPGIGASLVTVRLDPEMRPRDPRAFRGAGTTVGSADIRWKHGPALVFGEAAVAQGAGSGVLAGVLLEAGLRTSGGVMLRRYAPGFWSPFGGAYAQWSGLRNEEGVAFALETAPLQHVRITAFLDLFRRPEPGPTDVFPVRGLEQSVECIARLLKGVEVAARYALRNVTDVLEQRDDLGRTVQVEADKRKERMRVTVAYAPGPRVRVRARAEWCFVRYAPGAASETGTLLWQDIRLGLLEGLTVEARAALFDTPSYESRFSVMENDLPGVFSVPSLYGRGVRWYLLLGYRPAEQVRIAIRYAETRKEGVRSIGSGLKEIGGDTDNALGVQVDLRL